MKILSFKPGHDGNIAFLENGQLKFLYEAEKDSHSRFAELNPTTFLNALGSIDEIPDVIAYSGWYKGVGKDLIPMGAGYYGYENSTVQIKEISFLSKRIKHFSSSHERSHLLGGYGMSPFPQGQPCYALVWEGTLGDFYEIDENLSIKKLGSVLSQPGFKYSFLYSLAEPSFSDFFSFSAAGKLMALAGYSDSEHTTKEEQEISDFILDHVEYRVTSKKDLEWSPFYNIGVEHPKFKNVARKHSDQLFNRFYSFAKKHCNKKYPLIITGGCGLNCEWNTKWKKSGLFSDVFVPPVTNDTGSALGTAIDAQFHLTGNAKIEWDVYSGEEFIDDLTDDNIEGFTLSKDFAFEEVAHYLKDENVIAWIQGKCEIGPRALGNRSLLAAPFSKEMLGRLNKIKRREGYRPIAPICLEEDVSKHFDWEGKSNYMLFFQKVKSDQLKAITHVDGTARVQTVSQQTNRPMYQLLKSFKSISGFGVLCNTSLNFKGCGFINRTTDLVNLVNARGLDGFVVGNKFYKKIHAQAEEMSPLSSIQTS